MSIWSKLESFAGVCQVKKRIQAEKVIEDSLVKQLNEDRRKDIDKRKQDSTALRKPNDARPSKNTDTLQ